MTDAELLSRFCARDDQAAFRELAGRHAGLVYHTALRRTGDPELAREVSQTVFSVLAQKAHRLRGGSGLAGWLHRVATLQARNAARKESKRLRAMTALQQTPSLPAQPEPEPLQNAWPYLDEAMERLPERDREVLMAHYYQGRTYQEIARQRRESEAAVQRRASRAIEKLSAALRRRGIAVTVVTLTAGLSAGLQQDAPAAVLPSLLPSTLPATVAAPWIGSAFFKGAMVVLAAGLSGTITFGFARSQNEEAENAGRRAVVSRVQPSSGPLSDLKPLIMEPAPAGDWRGLMAGAAEVLRAAADRHATSRVAWMLAPLKMDEYPSALKWIAELPTDDKARNSLAGITLCLWAERNPEAAWTAFASFSPGGGEPLQREFNRYGAVLFLKRWDAAPAGCVAALSSKVDSRQDAAQEAMTKILGSESELARWREAVGKTPSDEARAQGAILALPPVDSAKPWESCLPWIFELRFNDETQRNKVLGSILDWATKLENIGAALSSWLEHLPEESAATVLPVMKRSMLAAPEEVRLKLSKVIKRPELLKALQESL